jgi:hypothetical protein
VVLKHLQVEYDIPYRIETDGSVVEGRFSVIRTQSETPELHEFFCRTMEGLVGSLPLTPSYEQVDGAIRTAIELFRALSRPARKSVAGIWAELLVIAEAEDVSGAVRAWHSNPFEKFDFSFPSHKVEVKASEKESREHEFGLEQLGDLGATPVSVLSIKMRMASGGVSVTELVREINSKLALPVLRDKLLSNVCDALGADFVDCADYRFDRQFAIANMRRLPAKKVPRVSVPTGAAITSVRFNVDIGLTPGEATLERPSPSDALGFSKG